MPAIGGWSSSRNHRSSALAPAAPSRATIPRSAEPMASARSGMCSSASARIVVASPSPIRAQHRVRIADVQVESSRLTGDVELFVDRAQLSQQCGRPVPADPPDDDQPDVALGCVDQVAVGICSSAGHHGQVGELGRLDRSQQALPAEDLRRGDGDHLHELLVGEAGLLVTAEDLGDLELVEQVLARGGRPVGPEGQPSFPAAQPKRCQPSRRTGSGC